MSSAALFTIPTTVLIIGSGVFGLSTAYSIAHNPAFEKTERIIVLDRSPFPPPDGSSIDTSRIIRADYADIAYARLALEAQQCWRAGWSGDGAYHESGLALLTSADESTASGTGEPSPEGQTYMQKSLANVKRLGHTIGSRSSGADVSVLSSRADIETLIRQPAGHSGNGASGDFGYVNWRGGWADAEAGMRRLREKCSSISRIEFVTAQAKHLLFEGSAVQGAVLTNDNTIRVDLTILAAGAWTPSLIDLRGIASATGQILTYLPISDEEQEILGQNPTILNESNGMFIITPSKNLLKVARHGYGHANPVTIPHPEDPSQTITVSVPQTSWDEPNPLLPEEGVDACRHFLKETFPAFADRPFSHGRLCWYTDTAKGDYIVSYHPKYTGLFVTTGGSGHAYKFLPVIGEKIVECILGNTPEDFREKWKWPSRAELDEVWTNDWRGGKKGMILEDERKCALPRRT